MKKKAYLLILKWGGILGIGLVLLNFLRSFADTFEFYPIGPVTDLLLVLLFIGALYLGIKEYRDDISDGKIKFAKAFFTGAMISLMAFVVMLIYLNINYTYVDKNALNDLNAKNELKYIEKKENEEVANEDITQYLNEVLPLLTCSQIEKNDGYDSLNECKDFIDKELKTIADYYLIRLQNKNLADSAVFLLGNFDRYAQKVLLEVTESVKVNRNQEQLTACDDLLTEIITNAIREMQSNRLLEKKIDEDRESVPQYENVFATALYFSLSVIFYGLLFSLFVALYLYRQKKEPESETENEELEIETEEAPETNDFQED